MVFRFEKIRACFPKKGTHPIYTSIQRKDGGVSTALSKARLLGNYLSRQNLFLPFIYIFPIVENCRIFYFSGVYMKQLEEEILKSGKVTEGNILKVGSFLNQRVDTTLLKDMAAETKKLMGEGVTKILTIEASGLMFATAVAMEYKVPLVFAKKSRTQNIGENLVSAEVYSFTHKEPYTIFVPGEYINENDNILICDDFLANGQALSGLIEIVEKLNASVFGCVVQIEKQFQGGGDALRAKGYKVVALASIKSMDGNNLIFN